MTIGVGDRVKHAIDDVQRGQFELALEHACIAIDVTSKRLYSADKSSKSLYKNLLDEYAWMIELMSLGGVNVNDSIFGNYSIPGHQNPKFKDLVYHIVRCNLVHDEGLPSNFMFAEGDHMGFSGKNDSSTEEINMGLGRDRRFLPREYRRTNGRHLLAQNLRQ